MLVDEYDRPVLNVLENREKAQANRDKLRNLYSILKDAEDHIRFVFVIGITMFSKTSFPPASTISMISVCNLPWHRFADIPIMILIRYLLRSWKD